MPAGIAAARKEIGTLTNQGPVPRFLVTAAGKLSSAALMMRSDGSKVTSMEALIKVYETGRTPQDKKGAYDALLKLTPEGPLNPALRELGLQPPVPVVRPKGDRSNALQVLGVQEPPKSQMTKPIGDFTRLFPRRSEPL